MIGDRLQVILMASTTRQNGFTLIEILVVLVSVLTIFVAVAMVIADMAAIVEQGAETNRSTVTVKAIKDHLSRDMSPLAMLGPQDGGFMVIVNYRPRVASDWQPPRLRLLNTTRPEVRSDQLMFFRRRAGMDPLTPGSDSSLQSRADSADYLRIWYGHLNPAGQSQLPQYSASWALGRQATFLMSCDRPGDQAIRADSARAAAVVRGSAEADTALGTPRLYHGLTDVVAQPMFGTAVFANPDGSPRTSDGIISDQQIHSGLDAAGYRAAVMPYVYGGSDRLQYDHRPLQSDNPSTGASGWRLGRLHPLLTQRVVDFRISFALDADNDADPTNGGVPDGRIDKFTPGSLTPVRVVRDKTSSEHLLHDSVVAGEADLIDHQEVVNLTRDTALILIGGGSQPEQIRWYDMDNMPPASYFRASDGSVHRNAPWWAYDAAKDAAAPANGGRDSVLSGESVVWVFRHDDSRQLVLDGSGQPLAGFSRWPYLVRVQFRIASELTGGPKAGLDELSDSPLYEMVFRVRRP